MPDIRDYAARRWQRGPYNVVLLRGIFRDEVRAWKDVWPALGGLLGLKKVRHKDADRMFDEFVAFIDAEIASRQGS